jgi:hypothetical protein
MSTDAIAELLDGAIEIGPAGKVTVFTHSSVGPSQSISLPARGVLIVHPGDADEVRQALRADHGERIVQRIMVGSTGRAMTMQPGKVHVGMSVEAYECLQAWVLRGPYGIEDPDGYARTDRPPTFMGMPIDVSDTFAEVALVEPL